MRASASKLETFILMDADFENSRFFVSPFKRGNRQRNLEPIRCGYRRAREPLLFKSQQIFAYPFLTKLLLGGLGLSVAQTGANRETSRFVITQVNPQGQAAKAGANAGDVLTKKNADSTAGMSLQEVLLDLDKKVEELDVLRGSSDVELKIPR